MDTIQILAIEDNPADQRLIGEMLRGLTDPSFSLTYAGRLEIGLREIGSKKIDVILLDLGLPDSRNFEGLDKIVRQHPAVPVIVLTGADDEKLGFQAIQRHAADYLIKGKIDIALLTRSIRYAIERKQVEEALALERNNLQKIFDTVSVGLLLINEQGVVKRVNNVISRWIGEDRPAVYNAQPGDILGCIHALNNPAGCGQTPHCDTCPIRKAFEPVLRSGEPAHSVEAEADFLIHGTSAHLWLDLSIDPVFIDGQKCAIVAMNDITQHKLMEAREKEALALAMSARTAMDALQAMGEAVLLMDMHGVILSVNPAVEQLSGYKKNYVLGKPLMEFLPSILPENERPLVYEVYQAALKGKNFRLPPITINCKRGAVVPVMAAIAYIRASDGAPTAIVLTMRDISQIRAMQQSLEENNTRLRALAARLASTEERERHRISAQIHDTVIQTLSLSNIKLGALRKELAATGSETTIAGVTAIRAAIEDAIRESRSLMAELTPPLLYELGLAPAITDLAQKLQKKHNMPIQVKDDEQPKPLDKPIQGILFQATRELILNALKHAGKCAITVTLARENDRLRICVEDNGAGFNVPEEGRFVFRNEGGFGLFTIRELLEGIGGSLLIRSRAGAGTSVSLFTPLAIKPPLA